MPNYLLEDPKAVQVYLDRETREKLAALVRHERRSGSAIIRELILVAYDVLKAQKEQPK